MHESLQQFHPVIGRWFEQRVGIPTPPQVMGWPEIAAGRSTLILAPTGSGKTLAAFLAAIDWLARKLMENPELRGVQILYLSPLKSLANDVQKNLVRPLDEMQDVAAAMGKAGAEWPRIRVGTRTGDTPQKERAAIVRDPPELLITTPESLNLMLTSGARSAVRTVKYVIVDEVHALAGNKRGVFTSLLLERLEEERKNPDVRRGRMKIAPGVTVAIEPSGDLVRVGLSATARPEEAIARFLGGYDDAGQARAVTICRAGQRKRLDLRVVCPFGVGEMLEEELEMEGEGGRGKSHWPAVTQAVLALIREHRSTLVFANGRRVVEKLSARLLELIETGGEIKTERLAGSAEGGRGVKSDRAKAHVAKPTVDAADSAIAILPHHGSISKEVRLETEQRLKRGELAAVVATSSLELGIDVGALDLVVQLDSPGSVAAGLQRVGRAGHLEKATAKGRLMARTMAELPALAAIIPMMFEGAVEETRLPENCLDVLAQQIVAACAQRRWGRHELFRVFKRSAGYRGLGEDVFDSVVAMLARRTDRTSAGAAGLRPKISWDRVNDELIDLPASARLAITNGGVIADTGAYPVYIAGGGDKKQVRIGELDEEFVFETKEGDRIVLGSQAWQVVSIDVDRVLVKTVDQAGRGNIRMPFWRGESATRSELLGTAIGTFCRELEERLDAGGPQSDAAGPSRATFEKTREWLMDERHLDDGAADMLLELVRRQAAQSAVPTDRRIVVEHFFDRTGEPAIAILCPLGSRVNYALRLALEGRFMQERLPAQMVHADNGIIIRPPTSAGEEGGDLPENPLAWLTAAGLEGLILEQLEGSALFGLRFRQNAARALMLPRPNVGKRTPLWQQRLRARHLLAIVQQERNFPIVVETYRECLQDALQIERARHLLESITDGQVVVQTVRHAKPSPMAWDLFSGFEMVFQYGGDEPLAVQSPEATVDASVLDAILQRRGAPAERGPAWTEADVDTLRRRITGSEYPGRTPEELLEKIAAAGSVALGPPEAPAWREWANGDARAMLEELLAARRLVIVAWGDSRRWAATEALAPLAAAMNKRLKLWTYRAGKLEPLDAAELPAAMLDAGMTTQEARRRLVEAALRREPIVITESVQREYAFFAGEVPGILAEIVRTGMAQKVGADSFALAEYIDQLRNIALRRQRAVAQAADPSALQRHLLRWHSISEPRAGVDALEDVLDTLAGVQLPLETWEFDVLPLRVRGLTGVMLDDVCAHGHRVWVGHADETVAFWPRHLLAQRPVGDAASVSSRAAAVFDFLQKCGASFQVDIELALGWTGEETAVALRELVVGGQISNDRLGALRSALESPRDLRGDSFSRGDPPKRSRLAHGWWKDAAAGSAGGRWFVLPPAMGASDALAAAERAADRAERLLRRHGFACRELIDTEVDGPWRACYDVLTRMEWAGSVRRGYFVEGITGSQFALPGVHLGSMGDSKVVWLAMTDPANLWARLEPHWTTAAGESSRISRVPGSWLAVVAGHPVLAATTWGERLVPLSDDGQAVDLALGKVGQLLVRLPQRHRANLLVKTWGESFIIGSPAEDILSDQGFTRDMAGLRLYRSFAAGHETAPPPAAK